MGRDKCGRCHDLRNRAGDHLVVSWSGFCAPIRSALAAPAAVACALREGGSPWALLATFICPGTIVVLLGYLTSPGVCVVGIGPKHLPRTVFRKKMFRRF